MNSKWIKYNNTIFMSKWNITLFPFIFLVGKNKEDVIRRIGKTRFDDLVNHESIHWHQQKPMFFIGIILAIITYLLSNSILLSIPALLLYYVIYIINWIINLFKPGQNAYENIAMEREAYANSKNMEYTKNMKWFSWIKYLKK